MQEKKFLWGVFGIALLVWVINIGLNHQQYTAMDIWAIRKELTYLTGIISFTFMGLIMLLAIRPRWLENRFHGLDKMYYIHKWAGIWAIVMAATHYLITLSGRILILFFERGVRGPRGEGVEPLMSQLKPLAKTLGEQSVWFFLIALVITLWGLIPYNRWRLTHKLMSVFFLLVVFHTVVLTPTAYWYQPVGLLFALISIVGSVCALMALFGLIGKTTTFKAKVIDIVKLPGDVLELTCQLNRPWQHKAGQYAFIKHALLEGGHPFTISSADNHSNQIRFSIKALGDYTQQIQNCMTIGDSITVEGPYGRFDNQNSPSHHQIWIGGGIGITPFIAWLEAAHLNNNQSPPIDLYYCIKNTAEATFATRLKALCAPLANVSLHIHYSDDQGFLTSEGLPVPKNHTKKTTAIWFCGPNGFANALKSGLSNKGFPIDEHFHQEYFQMR